MIAVNGRQYAPDDRVEWEDAIAHEGFYFERCRFLGLPRPPAAMFAPEDEDMERDRVRATANVRYHQLFKAAEEEASARMEIEGEG